MRGALKYLVQMTYAAEGSGGGGAAAAEPAGLAGAAAAAVGAAGGAPANGAGGETGGSAGGAAGAGGAPGAQSGAQGAAAPYYPEGLPDAFRAPSERETIDRLYADIKGRPQPPATAKDYTLELSPEMQTKFGDLKDDKVLPLWGEVAHELGLDNKRYNAAFEKLYQKMDKAGLIDHGPDYSAELQKLQPRTGSERERLLAAQGRINGAQAFIQGLEANGSLTKTQAAILHATADTAEGITLIEALQKTMGGTGLIGGGAPAQAYSRADYERDLVDPRYSTTSASHDPAFRRAVDEKAARLPRKRILEDGRVA